MLETGLSALGPKPAIPLRAESSSTATPEASLPRKPAVNPKRSVFPDHIISLEDGKPYKMLKGHLGRLGMTPEAYRVKWELPFDYPMTAPNYSRMRSEEAKRTGLGAAIRKTREKGAKSKLQLSAR